MYPPSYPAVRGRTSRRQEVSDRSEALEGGGAALGPPSRTTFAPEERVSVGVRVRVTPAHIDPTMALHPVAWIVRGDDIVDRWPIDLRGW